METGKFIIDILVRAIPGLYDLIAGAIAGGADAEKLRNEKIEVSIAFGGRPGHVVVVQEGIEGDMLDPNAE
jgi:hypothetical protein